MNTHDLHHIFISSSRGCLAEIRLVFLQLVNITNKLKQSFIAGLLIGRRLLHQHVQVSPPGLPCRHSRHIIIISRSVIHQIKQLMNRKIRSFIPENLKLKLKLFQLQSKILDLTELPPILIWRKLLAPILKSSIQSPILSPIRRLFIKCRHPGQLLLCESHYRAFKNRSQGDVLHRIVNNRQHSQNRFHLNGVKVSSSRLGIGRNPFLGQNIVILRKRITMSPYAARR